MSTPAARRARLLRLRAIEHRIACARLFAADAAYATVAGVSDRLTQLRDGILIDADRYRGHQLQSVGELATRLDQAQTALRPSLVESRATLDARNADRIAAHVAEQRTGRVHASALLREAAAQDLRTASSQPSQPRKAERRI